MIHPKRRRYDKKTTVKRTILADWGWHVSYPGEAMALGGGGGGGPPALVLSLVTLHNVWKSWHHRLLMGIKHGYLIVNVILGTTILDPPFNLIYRISRGVVGRMLEFREWACKWEGYSFLGVKSNSILFVHPFVYSSWRMCESVKGYLTRSPFPGLSNASVPSSMLKFSLLIVTHHF